MRALSIVLCASAALAQRTADERAAWNQPVAPFTIIGNVHYVGVGGVSSFLITTPRGHILLDGGLPESAPLIAASIAKLGFKIEDVKWLINSHAHFDHAGGFAELKKKSGAKLVASRADSETLAAGRHDDFTFPAVKVDRVIADGETVSLGDTVLTAHLTPGHTRGCTTWTLHVANHDVLFHCSTSVPGYRLVDNPRYPQIADDYQASFRKLRTLPCDVLLAPHGSFFHLDEKRARLGAKDNPFVDAAGCRRFIDESERDFQAELRRQTTR